MGIEVSELAEGLEGWNNLEFEVVNSENMTSSGGCVLMRGCFSSSSVCETRWRKQQQAQLSKRGQEAWAWGGGCCTREGPETPGGTM